MITLAFTAAVLVALPVLLTTVSPQRMLGRFTLIRCPTVAFARSEFESSTEGLWRLSSVSRALLAIYFRNGSNVLSLLYIMEPVSNPTRSCGYWVDRLLEWEQSIDRGTTTKAGGSQISVKYCSCVDRLDTWPIHSDDFYVGRTKLGRYSMTVPGEPD